MEMKTPIVVRFERKEGHHVELHLMADGVPTIDDDQNGEKSREPHEEHTDSINRKVIADSEGGDPWHVFGKLHGSRFGNESYEYEYGEGQLQEGNRQGGSPDHVLVVEQP